MKRHRTEAVEPTPFRLVGVPIVGKTSERQMPATRLRFLRRVVEPNRLFLPQRLNCSHRSLEIEFLAVLS